MVRTPLQIICDLPTLSLTGTQCLVFQESSDTVSAFQPEAAFEIVVVDFEDQTLHAAGKEKGNEKERRSYRRCKIIPVACGP